MPSTSLRIEGLYASDLPHVFGPVVVTKLSGPYALELPRIRPVSMIETPAHKEGIAPARKICCGCHPTDSMIPPSTGPTMEPTRPAPSAQPTPVDRIAVG